MLQLLMILLLLKLLFPHLSVWGLLGRIAVGFVLLLLLFSLL